MSIKYIFLHSGHTVTDDDGFTQKETVLDIFQKACFILYFLQEPPATGLLFY